jgi:hypothetical protein
MAGRLLHPPLRWRRRRRRRLWRQTPEAMGPRLHQQQEEVRWAID